MQKNAKSDVGTRFGRLVVTKVIDGPQDFRECKCDCGRTVLIRAPYLLCGRRTSCGDCVLGTCRFNEGVNCNKYTEDMCRACGWNPLVEHRRKMELEEYSVSDEPDVSLSWLPVSTYWLSRKV